MLLVVVVNRAVAGILTRKEAEGHWRPSGIPALANAMPQELLPSLSLNIWQQLDPQAHASFPASLTVFALPSI